MPGVLYVLGPDDYPYLVDPCPRHISFYTLYLDPYIKSKDMYICPSGTLTNTGCWVDGNTRSYNMNLSVVGYTGVKESKLTKPADTVLMCDSNYHSLFGDNDVDAGRWYNYREPYIANRHNDGANFLWCDGHVKWLKKNTLTAAQCNP